MGKPSTYKVALALFSGPALQPYESNDVEAASETEAITKAIEWAQNPAREVVGGSHLMVMANGKTIFSEKLGWTNAREIIKASAALAAKEHGMAAALVWVDLGAIKSAPEHHSYEATTPAGRYLIGIDTNLETGAFAGYFIEFEPLGTTRERSLGQNLKSADEAKAIAQRDHDRGW
jgi:hypothetical protein